VIRWIGLAAAALLFATVATANSGGYRYGASDQAFYAAAIAKAADPSLFPRDTSVLAPQMRMWLGDDVIAWTGHVLGLDQPALFAAIYVLTIAGLFAAAIFFARSLGGSWTMTGALLALLTLRHRIAKTGANSIEGYMQPRMVAFAIGIAALACVLRRRYAIAIACLVVAAVVHSTTAVWFAVVVAGALGARFFTVRWIVAAVAGVGVIGIWAVLAGPLASHFQLMDAPWLRVLAEKDYLFPSEWPIYAWAINLAYLPIVWLILRRRRAEGSVAPGESELVVGLVLLVVVFLVSVPLSAGRVALAVQAQVTRVFWVLDFVAIAYLAWWLDALPGRAATMKTRVALVGALAIVAAARGSYVLQIETWRPLAEYALPPGDWTDAMTWLRAQPPTLHVLADPGHAWKYGTSVRVAALKDTLLESGKDTALAMYDRGVAMRVGERIDALARFEALTVADVRALRDRFGLDVLVVENSRPFELPVLYRNARFVIYDLR
jgi:hypothetical protein